MDENKLINAKAAAEGAMSYYMDMIGRPNQAAKVRTEAQNIYGIIKLIEYIDSKLNVVEEAKPKRGNPNFGKNNPWNEKQAAEKAAKQGEV